MSADLMVFDMFNVHLDRNTVIKIPQISREKLNQASTMRLCGK